MTGADVDVLIGALPVPPWCQQPVEEEKPAAGEKPDVPSKGGAGEQQQTPPPPDAKPQSKKRTADEAGLPSEAPPAKAADSKAEDFSKLTVAQLKDKLKEAGVTDLSGKKADLVARLSTQEKKA